MQKYFLNLKAVFVFTGTERGAKYSQFSKTIVFKSFISFEKVT